MSLREKIAETISIKFDHQVEPDDYVDEIADSILALPEMKEMQVKAKHFDALQQEFPEWALSSNIVEPFRTWKEKAERR